LSETCHLITPRLVFDYNPRPDFLTDKGDGVVPADFELQLKVWKDLAVSKQMMMRTAAEALNLDPNCDQDELKQALDAAIKKVKEADASVVASREQARQSILEIEKKLTASQRAQAQAEAAAAEIIAKQERVAPQMAAERAAVAKEIQQLKAQIAEKDKALKAINTALADTPDNVVKKLKALKKEKQDESDTRKQIETSFNALRKEKQDQDKELTELREIRDNSVKLVTQHRELHELSTKLHAQLKPLVKDESELPALTELDTKTLEAISPSDKDDKKNDKNKKK
jgi:colicin import membrane protein